MAPPRTSRPSSATDRAGGTGAPSALSRSVSRLWAALGRLWRRKPETAAQRRGRAGRWGERHAERLLAGRGFRILGRRVRVGRRDEIDLVARDGETLVFVEVKARRSEAFGRPADAVKRGKRRAQSRAAMRYLGKLREKPAFFRFDVVEVVGDPDHGEPVVRHIANAFPLDARYRVRW